MMNSNLEQLNERLDIIEKKATTRGWDKEKNADEEESGDELSNKSKKIKKMFKEIKELNEKIENIKTKDIPNANKKIEMFVNDWAVDINKTMNNKMDKKIQ